MLAEVTNGLTAALPPSQAGWLPPRYNISHVSMEDSQGVTFVGEQPGRKLYRATCQLGPLQCQAVSEAAQDALQCLGQHLKSFLRTRDLDSFEEGGEEAQGVYVQGSGIVNVMMEGEGKTQVLPPLDIYFLQPKLKDGRFPPDYGARDEYGCTKVFLSDLTNTRLVGHEALVQHCQSERHQRRLGRFIVNGKTIETFRWVIIVFNLHFNIPPVSLQARRGSAHAAAAAGGGPGRAG